MALVMDNVVDFELIWDLFEKAPAMTWAGSGDCVGRLGRWLWQARAMALAGSGDGFGRLGRWVWQARAMGLAGSGDGFGRIRALAWPRSGDDVGLLGR